MEVASVQVMPRASGHPVTSDHEGSHPSSTGDYWIAPLARGMNRKVLRLFLLTRPPGLLVRPPGAGGSKERLPRPERLAGAAAPGAGRPAAPSGSNAGLGGGGSSPRAARRGRFGSRPSSLPR